MPDAGAKALKLWSASGILLPLGEGCARGAANTETLLQPSTRGRGIQHVGADPDCTECLYAILERTQRETLDITDWLQWFIGCLDRALDATETTLAAVLRKARFWEKYRGATMTARQLLILNILLDGFEGKLTSSKWAKLTKCSQDTAYRDIQDLMERGVLVKDIGGGRSISYSLKEV
jgi:hypothetical protein